MKKSILETIGNTPMIRLYGIEAKESIRANLFAKVEYFNPFGSIKDRVALEILENAEAVGDIDSNSTIVEASSGNMGIALSAIGAIRGYQTVIIAPENISERRKNLIKAFGGRLILTESSKGMSGAVEIASKISQEVRNSYLTDQFKNPSGVMAHYKHTAPEIFSQMGGRIDVIVCGIGTGGTITGIANYFYGKGVKIIGVEPEGSAFFSKGQKGTDRKSVV